VCCFVSLTIVVHVLVGVKLAVKRMHRGVVCEDEYYGLTLLHPTDGCVTGLDVATPPSLYLVVLWVSRLFVPVLVGVAGVEGWCEEDASIVEWFVELSRVQLMDSYRFGCGVGDSTCQSVFGRRLGG
jgi:hypothetical protein